MKHTAMASTSSAASPAGGLDHRRLVEGSDDVPVGRDAPADLDAARERSTSGSGNVRKRS